MPEHCYPGFEPGQTLTAQDLEVLRDFLSDQDRMTRQMIGFGIVCGLEGSIDGSEVIIEPGLAIDQDGEGALVDTTVTLDTDDPADDEFDFIDPGPGGFTPVLVLEDIEQPAPECDEEGCEGHATLWCRTPRVALVEGRLVVDANDFATEPLLDQNPVRVSATGAVRGAFVGLRNAISSRWNAAGIELAEDARTIFTGLTLESNDLVGIRAYKAAFLNQVLFATLDLLRCRSLHRAQCLRTEGDQGIALGWVEQAGATLTWDCRFRHHFQPPTGLVTALLGGRCDDPCELYRDRLESLILNFRVPTVPAPEDPPSPRPPDEDDYRPCKPGRAYSSGKWWIRDCEEWGWKVPPQEIFPDWPVVWEIDPDVVIINPQDWWTDPPPDAWFIYHEPALDLTQAGTITLLKALGKEAEATGNVLTQVLKNNGMSPNVQIVHQGDLGDLSGFTYEATVSMGDLVVLVADDQGKVAATGRIANAETVRRAEADLSDATGKADGAVVVAQQAFGLASGFDTRIGDTEASIGALEGFQVDSVAWQEGVQSTIDGIDQAVNTAVQSALPGVQMDLQGFINQTIGNERERWLDDAGAVMAEELHEFDQRVSGVEEKANFIEGQINMAFQQTSQVGGRVDDLYKFSLVEGGRTRQLATNRQLVDVLRVMRESIAASVTGEEARPVRERLARADDALAALGAASGSGPITQVAAEQLTTVIESLVAAAGAAGVPRDLMQRLQRDAESLFEMLG